MSFLEIPNTPLLYTVYTKSDCSYCDKIKQLMDEYNETVNYILCDEWLVNNRILFLNIMRIKTQKDDVTFPIVFFEGKYIGGFDECEKKVRINPVIEPLDFSSFMD
jgi:glutaredoxin